MARLSRRTRKGDPTLAVAYCRVSTDRTRQELGSEAQRAAIETWARRSGVSIVARFEEEVSGGSPLDRRPILLEALGATAAHGAGLLVVQRLDRFSRDPLTAALAEAELQRHWATLAVAAGAGGGTDPRSELVRGILFSVARFEKAMIRARIKAALDVKRRRGELTGVAPYGFRLAEDGKTLKLDPHEATIKERLRALRASGLTVREVLSHATMAGLLNRAGKPFTIAALHKLIRDASMGDEVSGPIK